MKKKLKVLCICRKGINRSHYLATYLRRKGYSTRFGGVQELMGVQGGHPKLTTQKDVDWADIIIIVRKILVPIFNKEFKSKDKKIIILEVTDFKQLVLPKKFAHFRKLNYEEFQKKWTYPQLQKGIEKYLPLLQAQENKK